MTSKALAQLRSQWMGALALFLVLAGGGAYAAGLAPNSVKSKQIKDGGVKSIDIANNDVLGTDVDESSLGKVPSSTRADSAASADSADTLGGKASSDFQSMGSEAFTPATLNESFGLYCSWEDPFSAANPAAFFRDRDGLVHLQGLVRANDGSLKPCGTEDQDRIITTLPAGYRPAANSVFATVQSVIDVGRIDVRSNGDVRLESSFDGAKFYVSLDGITFRCAPSGSDGCP